MIRSGFFYDGRSSCARKAVLVFLPETGRFRVEGQGGDELAAALAETVRFSAPLGDAALTVTFPCGGVFETEDGAGLLSLQKALGRGGFGRFVHALESRWPLVLAALAFVLVTLILAFRYGVPAVAREIAFRLPAGMLEQAGENTLKALDQTLLSPTGLAMDTQERLKGEFQALWQAHPGVRLYFRKGGRLGANALALPGSIILLTDELVALCEDNPEGLEGVLAHEIGHLVHRHAARRVVQDAFFSFLFLGLTGDGSGVAELFMGLPVLMTEMAYSRSFEKEADAYALAWLASQGKGSEGFARLLVRLHEDSGGREKRGAWRGYLSTHPLLEERLAPFRD
ncbi:M48 family metallopeptidase [Desulfobotulus sp.]|jgi:Zn-dependent protease with chaperone function|uniref:M48 family metallopeptidase n=1 Tax=Desulfobotulus sp. TaxID=1940337 RepID=UPI002A35E20E|nr:M48 family metallopeptidase [Desulfobotulus sp.]MDY0162327.1 M48 family metallopeptidase [Desulfobotulus sp.]